MYNGASCHQARIAQRFFEKEEIALINWLACSPDLNLIENIWSCLKRAINNQDKIPGNCEELLIAIREE